MIGSGWQRGISRSQHYLSVADSAHLWHVPQGKDLPEVPLVERGRARTFLAPAPLPTGDGWRIGTSVHAGHHLPVYLPWGALRSNVFAVASTGKGKSTLFLHLAEAALAVSDSHVDGDAFSCGDIVFIPPGITYRVCNRCTDEKLVARVFFAESATSYWPDGKPA